MLVKPGDIAPFNMNIAPQTPDFYLRIWCTRASDSSSVIVMLVKATTGIPTTDYKNRTMFTGDTTTGSISFNLSSVQTTDAGLYFVTLLASDSSLGGDVTLYVIGKCDRSSS